MTLDKQSVLDKANELLDDNSDLLDKNDVHIREERVLREGSFDEETQSHNDKSLEESEKLEQIEESKQQRVFNLPVLGYKRVIHYKRPSLWHVMVGILAIVGLIYIISLLLPYIPPLA